MGDFVKELTAIDFLGILLPGGFLILIFSMDYPEVALWSGYFGANCGEGVKITILLISGYVLGMLIHEVGDILEQGLLWQCYRCNPMISAMRKIGVENLVQYLSDEIQLEDKQLKDLSKDKKKAQVKRIAKANALIQTKLADSAGKEKRRLFDGFHVMARNFLLVIAIVIAYLMICYITNFPSALLAVWFSFSIKQRIAMGCFSFFFIFMMGCRCWHYAVLKYKYLFETFCELSEQKKSDKT